MERTFLSTFCHYKVQSMYQV